jgi:predicted Zn-dependent protease
MMLFKEGTVRAFSENALAMIAAHEISHLVMKHHGPSRGGHSTSAEKLRIKQEFEADHLGLMMMAIAGYDPQGAIEWMEYAIQQEKRLPNYTIPAGHHTHPPVCRFCGVLQFS